MAVGGPAARPMTSLDKLYLATGDFANLSAVAEPAGKAQYYRISNPKSAGAEQDISKNGEWRISTKFQEACAGYLVR
jgi:hypothetical protein